MVRFLAGKVQHYIFYSLHDGPSESLTGYSDSDWTGCHNNQDSTTDIFENSNRAPAYWTLNRHYIVSLSSRKAEFVATLHFAHQLISLRNFLFEICQNVSCAVDLHIVLKIIGTDVTVEISLATNPQVCESKKHIATRVHHICELIQKHVVSLLHTPKSEQRADLQT